MLAPALLQRLYDSEINVWITSFHDDGFYVRLGDEMNGFRAEGHCQTWDEVERWLDQQARIHYPDSAYARSPRADLTHPSVLGPELQAQVEEIRARSTRDLEAMQVRQAEDADWVALGAHLRKVDQAAADVPDLKPRVAALEAEVQALKGERG